MQEVRRKMKESEVVKELAREIRALRASKNRPAGGQAHTQEEVEADQMTDEARVERQKKINTFRKAWAAFDDLMDKKKERDEAKRIHRDRLEAEYLGRKEELAILLKECELWDLDDDETEAVQDMREERGVAKEDRVHAEVVRPRREGNRTSDRQTAAGSAEDWNKLAADLMAGGVKERTFNVAEMKKLLNPVKEGNRLKGRVIEGTMELLKRMAKKLEEHKAAKEEVVSDLGKEAIKTLRNRQGGDCSKVTMSECDAAALMMVHQWDQTELGETPPLQWLEQQGWFKDVERDEMVSLKGAVKALMGLLCSAEPETAVMETYAEGDCGLLNYWPSCGRMNVDKIMKILNKAEIEEEDSRVQKLTLKIEASRMGDVLVFEGWSRLMN